MDELIPKVIHSHGQLIDSHISQLGYFMNDRNIFQVCDDYVESKKYKHTLGFNVFVLTSDKYYRENYHSDIIKAFLNPQENHGQGCLFLNALIDMLNKSFPDSVRINKNHYADAIAKREIGKLDISIFSEVSKHCIIIENKIYNAGDMPRQLPRYYDYMDAKGFIVDAIIYLPLQQTKHPDTSDWTQEDKHHVLPILCHLPAYTRDETPNLVDNWIIPCSTLTNDIDCHSILRQYASLIKSLNKNTMDRIIISKFYKMLLEGSNLESALSIRSMLDDVPVVMAANLYERLVAESSYGNVWNGYKPNFCGVIFTTGGREYKIDTYSTLNGYEIYLFPNEDDRTSDIPWAESLPAVQKGHRQSSGEYVFKFAFNAEDSVVSFIKDLLSAANDFNSIAIR